MIIPPKDNKTPKLKRTANMSWQKGLVTSGGRMETPDDGLYIADNVSLTQEGAVESRAAFYTSPVPDLPSDKFSGPIFSYWNPRKEQFDLLTVCNAILYMYVAGSANWMRVPEPNGQVPFSMTGLISYTQYGNLIVIADSTNAIAYFSIPSDTVTPSVSRPGSAITTNPDMALSVVSGGSGSDYRAYYLISYVNDWGETVASGGGDFTTDAKFLPIKLADENNPLGKWETKIKVSITGVNAGLLHNTRVRIYRVVTPDFISPNVTNYSLVKEFQVKDGNQDFEDDGSVSGRIVAPQLDNSTGGLVARYVTELDGRIWAIGTGKEYQKLFYTGAAPTDSPYPQFFTGDGGYFYVGFGSSFEPVTIRRGRADDGQICDFVLCSGPNGEGRRFNIFALATTYGNQSIFHFYPSEQKGDEGAYSTFGVLDYMNSILYPSPGGFKSSGIRATYTGDNVTASIDTTIREDVEAIAYSTFKTMYGTIYNGKAIWHTGPTSVLVFDARAGGAWTRWTMSHSWFGALSVGRDSVALYLVSGNRVLRYADKQDFRVRDETGPENPVHIASGRLFASPEDGRQWVRVIQCLFIFSELNGPVEINLRANSRRGLEEYKGTIVANQEVFGASSLQGGEPAEWSTVAQDNVDSEKGEFGSPSAWSDGPFIQRRRATSGLLEVRVKVNKDVNFLDWEITSKDGFLGMKLEEFVYEYVDIGVGLDFSSRYNEIRMRTTRR